MKNIFSILLAAGLLFTACSKKEEAPKEELEPIEQVAPEETAPEPVGYMPEFNKAAVEALPLTAVSGTIVDFNKAAAGMDAALTAGDAANLAAAKQPFGFITKAGNKEALHLIYNADGTYPGDAIAALGSMTISARGRVLSQNGVSLFFAESLGQVQ